MTSLPSAIESCFAGADRRLVARAAAALSEAYRARADRPTAPMDDAARLAYLATRFPATLAALSFAAGEAAAGIDLSAAESILELGAGPGPALWAFADVLPGLLQVHQVDRDAGLLDLGRRLRESAGVARVDVTTEVADLATLRPGPADVVVISYALGELREAARPAVLERAWAAATMAVVLVEPGTTAGYSRVIDARARFIALGARIAAPCPHDAACPMAGSDWCHVPVRLARSRLHQQIKGVGVGFEDEKISYVVASRLPLTARGSRLVAQPEMHSGHVRLRLCTREGLAERVVSRREGDPYRRARKTRWGARWEDG